MSVCRTRTSDPAPRKLLLLALRPSGRNSAPAFRSRCRRRFVGLSAGICSRTAVGLSSAALARTPSAAPPLAGASDNHEAHNEHIDHDQPPEDHHRGSVAQAGASICGPGAIRRLPQRDGRCGSPQARQGSRASRGPSGHSEGHLGSALAAAAGLPARRRVARVAPVPHGGRPPRRPFARRAIRPKARRLRQKAAVEPDPEVNVCGHRTRRDRMCETEMACPQAKPTVHRPRRQPREYTRPGCAAAPAAW